MGERSVAERAGLIFEKMHRHQTHIFGPLLTSKCGGLIGLIIEDQGQML